VELEPSHEAQEKLSCGKPGFATPDGNMFLETHHMVPLGEDGTDAEDNIAAICPTHHREAHYGARRDEFVGRYLDISSDALHKNIKKRNLSA
jgi:HNH endonuclease